jgi:DNA-binding response OmpR family regulator
MPEHGRESQPVADPSTQIILVIEDNLDMSDALSAVLEEAGYRVVSLEDGVEALEAARLYQPGLITLDLILPGRDGRMIARELHEDPQTQDIPVLIISAQPATIDPELRRQVAGVIVKPFHVTELVSQVDTLLRPTSGE